MALWYCRSCTAAYAVGLPKCPQCGASHPSRKPVTRELAVDAEASTAGTGPAENLTTGQVTPAGQPLPEIPAEADAVQLKPAPARPAGRRKKASGGGARGG